MQFDLEFSQTRMPNFVWGSSPLHMNENFPEQWLIAVKTLKAYTGSCCLFLFAYSFLTHSSRSIDDFNERKRESRIFGKHSWMQIKIQYI